MTAIAAGRDANRDGFGDLLLEARGPGVVVGPKVRWDRRPLDAIRAAVRHTGPGGPIERMTDEIERGYGYGGGAGPGES